MNISASWLDTVKVERIICHWTAGSYIASSLDREHYHILIEGDGKLIQGKHPIKSIAPPLLEGRYAAHTLNLNSWSIGIAVCCMAGAVESPFDPGPYPITIKQWDTLVTVLDQLTLFYSLPVTNKTVLTHAEVQTNLGITQRGKWDIIVYPSPLAWEVIKASAAEVGDMLRKKVIDLRFTPKSEPTTSTAGWITDPNGSRFLVNAGWKWEEK